MNDAEAKSNPAYCSSWKRLVWPIAGSMAVHGLTRGGGLDFTEKPIAAMAAPMASAATEPMNCHSVIIVFLPSSIM